jgi:hypothetical protein
MGDRFDGVWKTHLDTRTFMALALSALLVSGCSTKTQPQADSAPQTDASSVTAKGEFSRAGQDRRVTLYVEGMAKIQGII